MRHNREERGDPRELSGKEQQVATDRGELAVCGFCGVLTWKEDLEANGLCQCGELPYIAGGQMPDLTMERERTNKSTEEFAEDIGWRIKHSIDKVQGLVPEVSAPEPSKEHFREREDPREVGSRGTLAEAVYSLRANLGVTQEDLAKGLGCHKNTIYNLETAQSNRLQKRTRAKLIAMALEANRLDLVKVFRK